MCHEQMRTTAIEMLILLQLAGRTDIWLVSITFLIGAIPVCYINVCMYISGSKRFYTLSDI